MTLLVLDIGGSAVKYGIWENEQLSQQGKVATPKSKTAFFDFLEEKLISFQTNFEIKGIAISCPGEVNEQLGAIMGLSFVPYLHIGFFLTELREYFKLPITMCNDAKCVALAEYSLGAGKNQGNYLYVVMGTGVGTAYVNEFGEIGELPEKKKKIEVFLAESIKALNNSAISMVQVSKKIAKKQNQSHLTFDGKYILEKAEAGDAELISELDEMYTNLARVLIILNLAYHPTAIVIGGGVTANPQYFSNVLEKVKELVQNQKDQLEKFRNIMAPKDEKKILEIQLPRLLKCKFREQANLIGAAKYFEKKMSN